VSSSRVSHDKGRAQDGEADWRTNCCFLPPWHERPKCTCQHPCIIDVWEFDDIDRTRRRYLSVSICDTLCFVANVLVLISNMCFTLERKNLKKISTKPSI
jgi:hypothetical protein